MSKSATIARALRNDIISGKYAEGTLMPSEHETAEHFGVSRVTSRKALQQLEHEGLLVSIPKRGRRVLLPPHTRNESKRRIAVFALANQHNQQCFAALQKTLHAHDTLAQFYPLKHVGPNPSFHEAVTTAFHQEPHHGLVLISNIPLESDQLVTLNALGVPWLQAGIHGQYTHNTICFDDYHAGFTLTQSLIEQGHQAITFLTHRNLRHLPTFRQRQAGYAQAMHDHNLSTHVFWLNADQYFDMPDIESHLTDALALGTDQQSTCIIGISSPFIQRIGHTLIRMGIAIPDDLSVCSFGQDDDFDYRGFGCSSLSCATEDIDHLAMASTQRLHIMLENPSDPPQHICLNPVYHTGDSVNTLS